MEKPLLSYTIWLQLSAEQKAKLVRLFSIPRTGEVVVHVGEMMNNNIGGVAKQDGHRPEDLYAITPERMAELLNLPEKEGVTHDFYALYQEVVDNLDAIYTEQYPDDAGDVIRKEIIENGFSVEYTPTQPAEEEFVPRDPEELIKPKVEVAAPAEELKTKKNAKAARRTKAN